MLNKIIAYINYIRALLATVVCFLIVDRASVN